MASPIWRKSFMELEWRHARFTKSVEDRLCGRKRTHTFREEKPYFGLVSASRVMWKKRTRVKNTLRIVQIPVIRLDYWRVRQIKCHDAKRLKLPGSATIKWRDIENKTIFV